MPRGVYPRTKKIVHSQEHRQKISDALRGRVRGDEHRRNLSISGTGKHGDPRSEETKAKLARPWSEKFSPESIKQRLEKHRARRTEEGVRRGEWSQAVLNRDDRTCRDCGVQGGVVAHHIKPWGSFLDLRFDVSNGITLCRRCHLNRHRSELSDRRVGKTRSEETKEKIRVKMTGRTFSDDHRQKLSEARRKGAKMLRELLAA